MIARLGAKAVLVAMAMGMAFFGVGLLGFALASSIISLFGLAGATAIAGGVLFLPPLLWALARLAFKPKKPQRNPATLAGVFLSSDVGEKNMLGWALTFLVLALVAGYMGFFGLAGLAATIAKLLLIVFVVLLIVSAFSGALRGRPPV